MPLSALRIEALLVGSQIALTLVLLAGAARPVRPARIDKPREIVGIVGDHRERNPKRCGYAEKSDNQDGATQHPFDRVGPTPHVIPTGQRLLV